MISVCIITKNEAKKIEICLKKLKEYPVEIIIIDTGSTDCSIEIAKQYTDNIYHFAWCDDFSAARNYAISKAHHSWILMVDTDELIEEFDIKYIYGILADHEGEVGRVERINLLNRNGETIKEKELISRLFQKELFHYKGSIHEQLVARDGRPYETFTIPLILCHTGYWGDTETLNNKADRNIKLLLKLLSDSTDLKSQDPYVLYQLGKSYYMKHDYKSALNYFEMAISFDLNPRLEYVLDLIIAYGYTMIALNELEYALNFEGIYKEFSYSADFLFLMGLIYMKNAKFNQAITEFTNATLKSSYMIEGVNSYKSNYNIGVIYECLGDIDQAIDYYKKCKEYDAAENRLSVLLKKQ